MDPIDTEEYEFTFGQYKGRSYRYVLKRDPDYIAWLLSQCRFALNESDRHELERLRDYEG